MKKIQLWIMAFAAAITFGTVSCGQAAGNGSSVGTVATEENQAWQVTAGFQNGISSLDLPAYSGQPYVEVNGNVPEFEEEDFSEDSFETYSDLDFLGRCGEAYANIGRDLMPTQERGAIGQIKPSGWHTVKYDHVDGTYLYNRCHLIGFQLSGENANEKNLITGTRYMNTEGMLPFENMVADYVKETDHHVLYRVTPVFEGEDLVAVGVLMEAESVEDRGEDIQFCVFVYNVQPGVTIDYETGDSWLSETDGTESSDTESSDTESSDTESNGAESSDTETAEAQAKELTYILNTNTKKFHLPGCSSVSRMNEANKKTVTASRDEMISQGYDPCGRCHP